MVKEFNVKLIRDQETGETRVKVFEEEIIEQLHHEETPSERMKKLIKYSKISAGMSIGSLLIALTLVTIGTTAEVVSNYAGKTRNIITIILFIVGMASFAIALYLDKKTKKTKKENKKQHKISKTKKSNTKNKRKKKSKK